MKKPREKLVAQKIAIKPANILKLYEDAIFGNWCESFYI